MLLRMIDNYYNNEFIYNRAKHQTADAPYNKCKKEITDMDIIIYQARRIRELEDKIFILSTSTRI